GGAAAALANPDDRLFHDGFVTKLSPTGNPLYSTYLGGSGDDYAFGVAVDDAGRAYVAGRTSSTNFPTVGPVRPLYSLSSLRPDAFVAQLDSTGSTLTDFSYLGGSDYDSATGVALDSFGGVYVAGFTYSTNFPTVNAAQPVYGGDQVFDFGLAYRGDAFVAKLGPATPRPQTVRIHEVV